MKLTMLGTGNAGVIECYNTCFILDDNDKLFLVDGGGGNRLLLQLCRSGYDWQDITEIFVTHKHVDHLIGILWLVRLYFTGMGGGKFTKQVNIYAHDEVIRIIKDMAEQLYDEKHLPFINNGLNLIEVHDGETRVINGKNVTFFDMCSTKAKQFGFRMEYAPGKFLSCCGDEPCSANAEKYVKGSTWLLHEAFCLYGDADKFHPYEKHHSTVKDACEIASRLGIENLLLYHTEEKTLKNRKELYTAEGKQYFTGNLHVPYDLESLNL